MQLKTQPSLKATIEQTGDVFTVKINSNEIDNRSAIEIACTLMHEILHAKISHAINIIPSFFVDNFSYYIQESEGKTYFNSHDYMINHYLQPMANFLKDYDNLYNNNNAPFEYYEDLAYESFGAAEGLVPVGYADEAKEYFKSMGLECNTY